MPSDATPLEHFWRLFDQGQHAQAEHVALEMGRQQPASAEPWYLRGALYQVLGRHDEALACYQQALQRNATHEAVLNNLGVLLTQRKQYAQAAMVLREKVRLAPTQPEGYCNLANALAPQGLLEEACLCYRKALELKPDYADAMVNFGSYLLYNGQLDRAMPLLERAVRLQPGGWEARLNYGQALAARKEYDAALEQLEIALKLRPDHPDILTNLGFVHVERKEHGKAIQYLRECATKNPEHMPAFKQLGIACYHLGRLEEAVVFFRHFLSRSPEHAEAHQNLGFVYTTMGDYTNALLHLQKAKQIDPSLMEAHNSIGILYGRQGMDAEALAAFDEALQLQPEHWDLHSNRAMILLRQKRFAEGWPEYEQRIKILPPSPSTRPQWQGEDLTGKSILLTWEQGLGDTIHFIRYAPLLKQRGARVIAAVQKRLFPLLRSVAGIDECVERDASPLPEHDVQAPLPSLPYRLGTLDAPVPYLSADASLVDRWRDEIRSLSGVRVGIAWQGDPGFMGDKHRSVPLRHFAALAAVPGVTLVSLQKHVGLEQIAANADRVPLVDLGPRLDNDSGAFMDTAAVMQHLDLVITSDTSIVHLAGALGVPVWMAVSYAPDWRWFKDEATSPWYPTLRLFRQSRLDAWDDVFANIAQALQETASARREPLECP
jgi:tetratricopeptide (TPR) repeat protein